MHSELAGTTSAINYELVVTSGWAGSPYATYLNNRNSADMASFSYMTVWEIKQ